MKNFYEDFESSIRSMNSQHSELYKQRDSNAQEEIAKNLARVGMVLCDLKDIMLNANHMPASTRLDEKGK